MLKRVFLSFTFLLIFLVTNGQNTDSVYTQVDQMPVFPGCDSSMNKSVVQECTTNSLTYFLQQNLIIPFEFQKPGFKDIVFASFIVNEEGFITQPTVLRGSKSKSAKIDSAAIASIKLLPRMLPGKSKGTEVKVRMNVGVVFAHKVVKQKDPVPEEFVIVEEMPVFQGCKKRKNKQEQNDCTNGKLFAFVSARASKVKLEKGEIEETVYVSFIISETGEIEEATIVKKDFFVQERLDSIALEIITSLPKFSPGLQRGNPVKVQYNVPIRFRK